MSIEDELKCPYCDYDILDCHNGGDPGPWWDTPENLAEPEEYNTECRECDRRFIVRVVYAPHFECIPKPKDTDKKDGGG